MPVINEAGETVTNDWTYLKPEEKISPQSRVMLALDTLNLRVTEVTNENVRIAVELPPDFDVMQVGSNLDWIDLVVLRFDVFSDGRAFSQARLLRERLNYRGDIRATGDVVADQIEFMRRCGFNQFDLKDHAEAIQTLNISSASQSNYQSDIEFRRAG